MTSYNKKAVSQKDIAEKAGVSISLVSFVLNDKYKEHRVSEEMAQKIKRIAKSMHYSPNIIARSLREGKTRTMGVILSDIANPFSSQLAKQIEICAEKYNYSVYFSSSDENSFRAAQIIENMLRKGVDGLIFVPCQESDATVSSLVLRQVPLVLLDRHFPDIKTSYICLDNRKAAYDATEHLIHNGFRKVGMILYDFKLQHMSEREDGYKEAMKDNGFAYEIITKCVSHSNMSKSCARAVGEMRENRVDAILMASNNIAIECLKILLGNGVSIPSDMGIVTFDGDNAFEFLPSPLSYIRQPLDQMAQKAVETLVEQIENGKLIQQVEFEGKLIWNASSQK